MSETIVKMTGICKAFSGVSALTDVNFELKSGEVHALLGENGAGKSTLMKILSGVYTKDEGNMEIFGEQIKALTPKRAQQLGVSIIHQELNMCRHLTVWENMFLGREKTKLLSVDSRLLCKMADEILQDLNIDLDPRTVVGDLPLSKQQMVEIAKALSTNARVLIMDEPTSALTAREIDELFRIIRHLRAKGCGIVYISHRLEELSHISDRVTILRDGKFVTSVDFGDITMDEIISNMVGREITEKFPRIECLPGKTVFEVKNLNAGRLVRNINFSLREGEIVGFAGLMGAGRTETTRAIFGIDQKESGELVLDGKTVKVRGVSDAIKAGIVLAPEDRKKDGLCTKLSISHNVALPNLDLLCNKIGVVSGAKQQKMCEKAVENLRIKLADLNADVGTLSGGNQQKVVVGKWLARNAKVVIFDEPTRGIDVAAKVEIYHLMNKLKKQGIAVMFVSSEMPEILGIADRIIVMCDGRITGELNARKTSQEEILTMATAFEKKLA